MNSFFAVLLLALAGVAVVVYLRRLDENANLNSKSDSGSMPNVTKTLKVAKAETVNVKAQHVAAITAAILAATRGRGRILNIVPLPPQPGLISSDATRRWRSTAIVASVGRRLVPSWKR